MKTLTSLVAISLISLPALASDPWGDADPKVGKEHHDKACIACHVRLYGGDGSKMYTREGRVLSDKLELMQRVAACNSQVNSGWFPEDEGNVAAWLNKHYYHFTK